jgi:hypothetical protein
MRGAVPASVARRYLDATNVPEARMVFPPRESFPHLNFAESFERVARVRVMVHSPRADGNA